VLCRAFPDLEISIVRISNVYGPNDKGRVIPLFVQRALVGEPLMLFGIEKEWTSSRVNDVVNALSRLGTGSFISGPLNLGSGTGVTILDLAHRVTEPASSPSEIRIAPAREVEVSRFVADVSAARAALGWTPPADPLFGLPEVVFAARS
jgi:nucleoside-diphosphate-sugar epimerase